MSETLTIGTSGDASFPQTVKRPRVVMLVSNPCTNDTRVIRAAEAVAGQGFDTIVLALSNDAETSEERQNGVLFKRIGRPWIRVPPPSTDQKDKRFSLADCLSFTVLLCGGRIRIWLVRIGSRSEPKKPTLLRRLAVSALRSVALLEKRVKVPSFHDAHLEQIGFLLSDALFPPALLQARRMRRTFLEHLIPLKPDIVHAHDLVMLPTGAAAANALGAKLIYDAHELEVHRNTASGSVDKWLRAYLEGKYIQQCDTVITVCDSIADHLAKEYSIERPLVVMNAPDIERQSRSKTDLRSRLDLSPDIPLTVYVGRITIGRGIEQSIRALQHLPGYHLALVGPTHPPTVDVARRMAEELGVAGRLHVVAPVLPDEVIQFVKSADVSIVPIQNVCLSYYYCLPNKLLESALAGLPVVVSNFPELRRFVELSGSGLVMNETDPADIARAIREAYENKDRLLSSDDQLACIKETYGWKKQKKTLDTLYASFASSRTTDAEGS